MSVTFYLIKPSSISLEDIKTRTSIIIEENSDSIFLTKNGESLCVYPDEAGNISTMKVFSGNKPYDMFKELAEVFNLYMVSEYVMREFDFDVSLITEEYLENYRRPLFED